MGYFFATLGTIAGVFALLSALVALANGTDIQLILSGVCWISAMIGWASASIIFRMDDYHSKKDTPQ